MTKSAPHPWEKARPSPIKGALKKAFFAFFTFCAVHTSRTPHEPQTQSARTPSVIYFTKTQHNGTNITPATDTKTTFTYANTRGKFPEASPKGPGSKQFRTLAGQQPLHTLGSHELATRPPKPDSKNPQIEKKTSKF